MQQCGQLSVWASQPAHTTHHPKRKQTAGTPTVATCCQLHCAASEQSEAKTQVPRSSVCCNQTKPPGFSGSACCGPGPAVSPTICLLAHTLTTVSIASGTGCSCCCCYRLHGCICPCTAGGALGTSSSSNSATATTSSAQPTHSTLPHRRQTCG